MAKKRMKYEPKMIERPPEELEPLFLEHLDSLATNCRIYDSGSRHFAAEIALNLRVLLFDNKENGNRSLLHQVKRDTIDFFDTEKTLNQGNPYYAMSPAEGLVYNIVTNLAGMNIELWFPHLSAILQKDALKRNFASWWDFPVFHSGSGAKFTRKRIIRNFANQDRGGHVAEKIEEDYYNITRKNQTGHKLQIMNGDYVTDPSRPIRPEDIVQLDDSGGGKKIFQALIRQIAHETLLTLLPNPQIYISTLPPPPPSFHPTMFVQFHLVDPKY